MAAVPPRCQPDVNVYVTTGGGGSSAFTVTAGETLSGGRLVRLDDTGAAVLFDPSDLSLVGEIAGITTGAAASGSDATIQPAGRVSVPGTWSFPPGAALFAGPSGTLVAAPPAAPTLVVLVGSAVDGTDVVNLHIGPYLITP